jgi:hypothetical protein
MHDGVCAASGHNEQHSARWSLWWISAAGIFSFTRNSMTARWRNDIVVGHFGRRDPGHVMQAPDVTRHWRLTQQLVPPTTILSFVCCSQVACKKKKKLLMTFGTTSKTNCCSAAFLDITQSFHKVWHTGLLYKLRLSLPLNYIIFLKSYMQTRHFLIKIENKCTELFPIHIGIPQAVSLDHYYIYYSLPTSQLHQKLHQQLLLIILQS